MNILGIIPARGGSKGIPRKNIKALGGKPLLAYTIEAAKESGVFSRVVLSTDDEEIAAVGKQCSVEVPFMRPAELAEDTTPTLPVLIHAVTWLKEHEHFFPDYTVILQPTAPFREPRHLREAIALLISSKADSVVSVAEVPGDYNPHWQFNFNEERRLTIFTGEPILQIIRRRQDLPKTYTRDGAIYAFRTDLLFGENPNFYGKDIRGYLMENKYALNIDSVEDWALAELRVKELYG